MILITGASGYLGARIANYLLESENKIILGVRSKNQIIPKELENCEIVEINMEDQLSLQLACKEVKTILHLAGMNSADSKLDPKKAILVNSKGTLNLLNAAKLAQVNNFIYFSTAHVYGSPLVGYFDEDSELRPEHPYSISNHYAENYILSSSKDSCLNCTIFRLSNAVGRPLNKESSCWSLITNDLCKSSVTDKKLCLNSNRLLQRDFISIDEVCRVILFFINNNQFSKKTEIYNLSSGVSINLESLTDLIAARTDRVLGYTPKIIFESNAKYSSKYTLNISNKKLKKLGFNPSRSIIDDIDDLLILCKTWFQ